MPRFSSDIKETLYGEDVAKLYERANFEQKTLIALLWLTAARPSELAMLAKEDVFFDGQVLVLRLRTKKLGKEGTFAVNERTLEVEYADGEESGIYVQHVVGVSQHAPDGSLLLPKTTRWQEQVLNKLGLEALGRRLCPYHFRHSVLTLGAGKGLTIDNLMYLKGSKNVRSVAAYVHARPVRVSAGLMRRNRIEMLRKQ